MRFMMHEAFASFTLIKVYDIMESYSFYQPPKANWQITFGLTTNTYIQIYVEKPPNKFQRWMMQKVLGIYWKKINENLS
jgi:hypothetical protein